MPRLAVVPELDNELDRLYGLQLEEFTSARNELAARLKKAGQADAAGEVRALKKPSVVAWTVNQLARRHADAVAALIEAGGRLRDAQSSAFRGAAGDAVRDATRDEREALRALTRLAEGFLSADGRPATPQTVERITATLRAASIDPAGAELLRRGRLSEELEPTGFATVASIAPAPSRARGRAKSDTVDPAAKREHARLLARLRKELAAAERVASNAEAEAERAARGAADSRERAKRARREAREAASVLAKAERSKE